MGRPLVLYHASCADGFCAAWAARRALMDCEYVPVQYGQEPPEAANDKDRPLYILDFSYSRNVMFRLAAMRHERMIVLDHHKSAQKALGGLEIELASNNCGDALTVHFDLSKSGARLAWEHFHPDLSIPWLVEYVEDRDLWRWNLWQSREINAAIASYPNDFELWDRWHMNTNGYNGTPAVLAAEGTAILRYQAKQIEFICAHAHEIDLDGHRVLSANTPLFISEVGEKLATGRPFSATFFIRADGRKVWSLRSAPDGIDVSEVAKRHGGGGHFHAAGYEE